MAEFIPLTAFEAPVHTPTPTRPTPKRPEWLKARAPTGANYQDVRA